MIKLRDKSLGKVAKQGIAWTFAREGITEVILFPASMVTARLLTPREFGIAVAATFFLALSGRLAELGFNAALIRSKVIEPVHLSTVFVIKLVTGLTMFGVMAASAPAIGAFYNVPETREIVPIAALGFLIAPFGTVPAALLARELRYRQAAVVDWMHVLTRVVVTIITALYGYSYMSLIYGALAGNAVQVGLRNYFAPWRPSLRVSISAVREILPFGAGVHAKRLLDYLALNVDNLLVGKLMGMAALGFYDKAFSTMDRLHGRFDTGGRGVMFRIFAIIHDQPERFARAYAKVLMVACLLAFPTYTVLLVSAEPLMVVLFGERWLPAAAPFQVLCAVGCFRALNSYASSALQAAGWVWSEVSRQVAYIALIMVNLFLFREWGVVGAAVSVLIASTMMTVAMHVLLQRVTGISWSLLLRPQIPGLCCAVVAAVVVLSMKQTLQAVAPDTPHLVVLMAYFGAAALVCGALVLFFPHPPLRAVVQETAVDLLPEPMRRTRVIRAYLQMHDAAPSGT